MKRDALMKIRENFKEEESDLEEVKNVCDQEHDLDNDYLPSNELRNIEVKKSQTKTKQLIPSKEFNKLKDITRNFTMTFKEIADDRQI